MIFKNEKVYDTLKWLALVCLPALAVYCGTILPLPIFKLDTELIRSIIVIIDATGLLIGALIGISGARYKALLNKEESEQILDESEPVELDETNSAEDYSETDEA